jgi:DNA-directed RNA polymerase subunit N (RpoN/RPB10)
MLFEALIYNAEDDIFVGRDRFCCRLAVITHP